MKNSILKGDKGITIISLIVIVVIMIIVASVSIDIGTDSINSTRLKGFYSELEIIQKRVDDIISTNETYIDENNVAVALKDSGTELTGAQQESLQTILTVENISLQPTDFKYFTTEDLENKLDLLDMNYNVFINFENRIVIAENGITIEDETYYVLKNTIYFVEQNTKDTVTIESLDYTVTQYGKDKFKVVITPNNETQYLTGEEYVKYKKTTTKYWETSSNTEIILELNTEYNIIYSGLNNNVEKVIEIVTDSESNLTVTEK